MADDVTLKIIAARRFRAFLIIWLGQTISVIGFGLTAFTLSLWVYQQTNSVTQFSLIIFCAELPSIALSFITGLVADRWDRRILMIISNLGAAVSTLTLSLFFSAGRTQLWHICILAMMISICKAFLSPAFSASITLMVPKPHLGRASGLMQTGQAAAQILSPVLAGFLVLTIDIQRVLLIDVATYIFAILTLLVIDIPKPETDSTGMEKRGSMLRDAAFGWTYIIKRPGLVGIFIFFAVTNLTVSMSNILIAPLVLGFTNSAVYGSVLSATGVGLLTGGILMTIWVGPKQRIYGVYFYGVVQGLALILEGLRPSAALIGSALFLAAFSSPVVRSCFAPILQSKIPIDVQGRVFAAVNILSWFSVPVAYMIAGPLADKIFEPLLAKDGALAGSAGAVIGAGPGRGIGLLFIVLGLVTWLTTLKAYRNPRLRYVETELPDMISDTLKAESSKA
jgi:MFS transporter, DHA3 family, macrolide efflux protein